MFSDGYADQFGGEENTKFNAKNLVQFISQNTTNTFKEQELILKENILNWMGNQHAQIDDILVLGFKEE